MRTIEEVLNIKTGDFLKADYFFSLSEETIFQGRRKLEESNQRKEKLLVCPYCYQPVKIRGFVNGKKTMHFAHLYDSGDCPIKTTNKYSKQEIERMKYNGQKESEEHIKLKEFIASCLEKDERFSDLKVEKNFNSKGLSKEWKRPDVSAKFKGLDIVFEVQLSTTFLSVIVEREVFYRDNKTFIIWFFNKFNPDVDSQKFTEKDIIYSNKNNAFLINDETIEKSEKEGKFIIKCYYQEVLIKNNAIEFKPEVKEICFDDLKFDYNNYKLFYYDPQSKYQELSYYLKQGFIKDFENFWLERNTLSDEEKNSKLFDFQNLFQSKNINFTINDSRLNAVLDAIYSLKYKKMINYKYKNFISLANHILEYRQEYAQVFLLALSYYGIEKIVLQEDKKGAYRNKLHKYKLAGLKQNDKYNKLFETLFPEL